VTLLAAGPFGTIVTGGVGIKLSGNIGRLKGSNSGPIDFTERNFEPSEYKAVRYEIVKIWLQTSK